MKSQFDSYHLTGDLLGHVAEMEPNAELLRFRSTFEKSHHLGDEQFATPQGIARLLQERQRKAADLSEWKIDVEYPAYSPTQFNYFRDKALLYGSTARQNQ